MVSIKSYYGDSASAQNNAKMVAVGPVKYYFSYETLVAVESPDGFFVRQNDWSTTTGRHINSIDGGSKEAKARRLTAEEFEEATRTL